MMKMRDILCDSGSFITLTGSCMDGVLYFLHEKYGLRFIIPPSVEYETVTKPLYSGLNQFAFSALRIKRAINDGIIVKVEANVRSEAHHVLELANNLFLFEGHPMTLIQMGEAETIALAARLGVNDILVDERTMRMLIEAPFRLKEHLESEFGTTVMVDRDRMQAFSDLTREMTVLRSSEMAILACENGFFDHFGDMKREAIEASLYRIKYAGCSIRFDEIREYVKSIRQ